MKNITEIWNLLIQKLQDENLNLQVYNNPTHQDRKPEIGAMVFLKSPVTKLVKGYNKSCYGGHSIYYHYSLQVGCATKVDIISHLRKILDEIKTMFISEVESKDQVRENSENIFLSLEGETISVNIDFEGSNFNSISVRIS